MSDTKFTPGPWSIWREPISGEQSAIDALALMVRQTTITGDTLYLISDGHKCPAVTGCGPTSEANAHLIAAAPDLYAALEHVLAGSLSLPRFAEDQARAALKRARGETS